MHSINLVMIVRNEARCLTRCLASARPWVDAMIVLDTGSTDDTVALAQAAGAQVHHLPWPDDFAKARNAALDLSQADWNLVLDADEWLADGAEALQALRDQAPTFMGRLSVCSLMEDKASPQGQTMAASWIPRVLPKGVRYQGRIHEQPLFAGPRVDLPVHVGHDGYLPEHMHLKGPRNQQLLVAALQERPDDPYLHYQLGKDHEVNDRFEQAWPHYEQALAKLGPFPSREPAWRHDLVLRALYVLKATGQTAQAVNLAASEMGYWDDSPDFYFVMGDVLLDHAMAHQQEAENLIPMIESSWLQCLEIGENSALEGSLQGRGSWLAAHNLAGFYEATGRTDEAQQYREMSARLKGAR